LSIIVEFADLAENGMPTSDEHDIVGRIGKHFDENLKADGNALFLARITWNGMRQFLYRIYDPEIANAFLTDIVDNNKEVRPFELQDGARRRVGTREMVSPTLGNITMRSTGAAVGVGFEWLNRSRPPREL